MSDEALAKVETTLMRLQMVLGVTRLGMLTVVASLIVRAVTSAPNPVARAGIAGGIVLLIGAAGFAVACVLQLRRLAQSIDTAKLTSMRSEIEARSRESRFRRLGVQLFIAAITLGGTAAVQHLVR